MDLRAVAPALGGEVMSEGVSFPGPGHSRKDRSACLLLGPEFPEGFWIKSYAGDDEIAIRDHVRERLCLSREHRSAAKALSEAGKNRSAVIADPGDPPPQKWSALRYGAMEP